MTEQQTETYCGFIAIVGRPNVGKSTLLNKILGQKISITSRKAQTTRHRIVGIKTEGAYQEIYVDTPGLHIEEKRAINRLMNRAASSAITDVDLVIFVVDGTHWNDDDEMVLNKLRKTKVPVVLAINKIDNIKNKDDLLPFITEITQKFNFADIVPISAEKGNNLDAIEKSYENLYVPVFTIFRKIMSPIVHNVLWPRKLSVKSSSVLWAKNCLIPLPLKLNNLKLTNVALMKLTA